MSAQRKRLVFWLGLGALVLIGLALAFWPRALAVDLIRIEPGPMLLTVGDEGRTRLVDVFVISAPIAGRLRRIEAEPGDSVQAAETVIADIEPTDPALLDPRTEAEARAQLSAAESAAVLAGAELEKAQAELQFADSELRRARDLAQKGSISERELDAAARAFKTSRATLSVAQAAVQVRQFELERVRAQLMTPDEMSGLRSGCDCVSLKAPVDGQILQVLRESEGFVAAGEPIAELGNPERLEVVVDLLSTDAVKVAPGQRAIIDNWGGAGTLEGRVRLVEPFGFTQVSALGIEEQRVNVIVELTSPRTQWQSLGHGFQVDVRVVLWETDAALKVPLTALFRTDGAWMVFVVEDGRARLRGVTIGHQSDNEAEVLSGIEAGEAVIVYPGQAIDEGLRVVGR